MYDYYHVAQCPKCRRYGVDDDTLQYHCSYCGERSKILRRRHNAPTEAAVRIAAARLDQQTAARAAHALNERESGREVQIPLEVALP